MKQWIAGVSLLAIVVLSGGLQPLGAEVPTHEQVSQVKSFLFVHNSSSGSFENGRLSLDKVGPVIFFSDRPYRVFGHTDPEHFIDAWTKGADSFAEDPPNAVLSLLGEQVESFVVVLSDPRIEEGTISYQAEVQDGTIPSNFGEASLFIDNNLWAAVGGLAVGRVSARRQEARTAAAFQAGHASAKQDENTYYQAQPGAQPQPAPAPAAAEATPEQQLEQLKQMLDKGLISQQDYDKKKQEILQNL